MDAEKKIAEYVEKKPRKTRSDKGKKRAPRKPGAPKPGPKKTVNKAKSATPERRRKEGKYMTLAELRTYLDWNYERVIDLFYDYRGNVTEVANDLNVRRQTLNRLINEREGLKDHVEGSRLTLVDTAENALFEVLTNPKHPQRVAAAIWTTKTIGKDRGWIERPQDDRSFAPQINIQINAPWQQEATKKAEEIVEVEAEVVKEIEEAKEDG
jgi:hypothetical protein